MCPVLVPARGLVAFQNGDPPTDDPRRLIASIEGALVVMNLAVDDSHLPSSDQDPRALPTATARLEPAVSNAAGSARSC